MLKECKHNSTGFGRDLKQLNKVPCFKLCLHNYEKATPFILLTGFTINIGQPVLS